MPSLQRAQEIESKSVAIFGINYLALTIGAKVCEQGHSVILFPPENSTPEELETAREFTKAILTQLNETSLEAQKNHLNVLNPRFSVSSIPITTVRRSEEDRLQHEMDEDEEEKPLLPEDENVKVASPTYPIIPEASRENSLSSQHNPAEPSQGSSNAGKSVRFSGVPEIKDFVSELATHDLLSMVIVLPEDSDALVLAQKLKIYLEIRGVSSSVRVSALLNHGESCHQFAELGVVPIYKFSAISELASRVASARTQEIIAMEQADLVDLVHPMEQFSSCKVGIRSPGQQTFAGIEASDYHKWRVATRMSFQIEEAENAGTPPGGRSSSLPHFGIFGLQRKQEHVSALNQFSGLSVLGLADQTISPPRDHQHSASQQLIFDIYSSDVRSLSHDTIENSRL
jgi:hypothetical protein